MDPTITILIGIIIALLFALMMVIMCPIAFGIPVNKLILAKITKSMLILTLTPEKRLVINVAKAKSSIIETKKGSLYFLNVPDAVYSMLGIPTAIAYHKYGAILPVRNIVHATKMREKGFFNIGELKHTLQSLQILLQGDSKTLGLYDQKTELEAALEESDEDDTETAFTIPLELEHALIQEKKTHQLLAAFRNAGQKIPLTAKIAQLTETEWQLATHKAKYLIRKEATESGEEILKVYTGKLPRPVLQEDLTVITQNIAMVEEKIASLEETEIEDSGLIKIQDIFNFLDKNLSTDVIFSVIERATAEELRDMRDFKRAFVDLFPYILTLFFGVAVCYVIIMSVSDAGVGGSLLGGIPNLAP